MISDKALINVTLDFIQNSMNEIFNNLMGFIEYSTVDKSIKSINLISLINGYDDCLEIRVSLKNSDWLIECVISGSTYPLFSIPLPNKITGMIISRLSAITTDAINISYQPVAAIKHEVIDWFTMPKTITISVMNGEFF